MGCRVFFFVLVAVALGGCGEFSTSVRPTSGSELASEASSIAGDAKPASVPPALSDASSPKAWVYKSDESLVQYIGGDIDLSVHQSLLTASGITVYARSRALKKDAIPNFIQPKDTLHRLSADVYSNPATPIYSGVYNAFQIAAADLNRAQSAGFLASLGEASFAVPCSGKDTLMIFGQSNSANSGDVADRTPIPNVYMFYNGFCYPAADPILGATMYNGGGSVWMPLARRFAAMNPGRELVLFSFGVGGSAAREWAEGGRWSSRLNLALSQARSAGLRVTKVFYHQGESDTIDRTHWSSYISSFSSALATVRAGGVSAPVYMAVASYMALRPYYISRHVQNAQLALIEQGFSGVQLGLIADFMPEEHRSIYDGLHFSQSGLVAAGLEWYTRAFTPQNSQREIIRAYYNVLLSRNPTESDLDYWQSRRNVAGRTLHQIRDEISQTNEAFIRDLYLNLGRRQPEYDGYVYWYNALQSRTRSDVQAEFEVAIKNLNLGGDLFSVMDGTLQPRADRFRFDRSFGLWTPN